MRPYNSSAEGNAWFTEIVLTHEGACQKYLPYRVALKVAVVTGSHKLRVLRGPREACLEGALLGGVLLLACSFRRPHLIGTFYVRYVVTHLIRLFRS